MPRGALVNGALAGLAGFGEAIVLCHMRRHADGAKVSHVIGGIVGFVLTDRDAAAGGFAPGLQHDLRGAALGGAISMRDHAGHCQTMSVLHGGMPHIAELCLPPGRLAIKAAVWVAGTRMGVVLALLAMKFAPSSSSPLPSLGRK